MYGRVNFTATGAGVTVLEMEIPIVSPTSELTLAGTAVAGYKPEPIRIKVRVLRLN